MDLLGMLIELRLPGNDLRATAERKAPLDPNLTHEQVKSRPSRLVHRPLHNWSAAAFRDDAGGSPDRRFPPYLHCVFGVCQSLNPRWAGCAARSWRRRARRAARSGGHACKPPPHPFSASATRSVDAFFSTAASTEACFACLRSSQ